MLPGTVVYCRQVAYASNHTQTGSLLRLKRSNRSEALGVLKVDKSPSEQQSEIMISGY